MPIIPKDQLRKLIKQYNLKDTEDIQSMLKDMFGDAIQEMLEAELEEDLGYSRYDYKNKRTTNSRNGYSKKVLNQIMVNQISGSPGTVMEALSQR